MAKEIRVHCFGSDALAQANVKENARNKIANKFDVNVSTVTFTKDEPIQDEENKESTKNSDFQHTKEIYLEDVGSWQHSVDSEIDKQKGLITRRKDPKMCRHGPTGMCTHCMPLEPFDKDFMASNGIKHLSFHAHLRKVLTENKRRGDVSRGPSPNLPLPLDEPNYKVKTKCPTGHAPWPEGMCSKCQPSSITLQPQTFRMVDHVEFSNPQIINNFLDSWRSTANQRIGFLFGNYKSYSKVPLGIKAVVEAIYEPAQRGTKDSLEVDIECIEHKSEMIKANHVAAACGLRIVGIIFTDLVDNQLGQGKCVYRRRPDTFFISSLECNLASQLQLKYPNLCRWANGSTFGSKFVTCCITANKEGDIEVSAWQVSNAAMAMQDAGLICPSTDPSMVYVRPSTNTLYVPEIRYLRQNEYGLKVEESAKPAFPVEYLLVNLTYGVPNNPQPLFKSHAPYKPPLRSSSTTNTNKPLSHIGGANDEEELFNLASDFNLLADLYRQGQLSEEELQMLASLVTGGGGDGSKGKSSISQSSGPTWKAFLTRIQSASNQSQWKCDHCTLLNPDRSNDCEACGLPRYAN